jgi:hypothetical protein
MSVKISDLRDVLNVGLNDYLPIARLGAETYKTPASQFASQGTNLGAGPGQFFVGKTTTTPTTLQFRTLSASGENLTISTVGNTVVVSSSAQNPIKTTLTGNGSQTSWPLVGFNSSNAANYRVDFDGVLQEPFVDYTIGSGTIQFIVPPPASTKIVVVSNNMVTLAETLPAQNTITNSMLTVNSVNIVSLSSDVSTTFGTNPWRVVATNFNINEGDRIAVNTSGGALTGTLPASPLSGAMVTLGDLNGTWNINNLTINGNGQTILGDSTLICNIPTKFLILFYNGIRWSVFL